MKVEGMKLVVGRIVRHEANCACGELKGIDKVNQECPRCNTKVLDILYLADIESDDLVDSNLTEETIKTMKWSAS